MLKNAAVVAGAAATMLAMAPVANAASGGGGQDNDGINVLNDSNVSVVPIQACGNNIIGPILPLFGNSQKVECTQATIEKGKH